MKVPEDFLKELSKKPKDFTFFKTLNYFPVDKRDGDQFFGVQMGKVFALQKNLLICS